MPEDTFKELRTQLQTLRSIVHTGGEGSFRDLFDEFMREGEYGLALHVLCDSILEPDSPRISKLTLDSIQQLHVEMKIHDHCVKELRTKLL